MLQNNALTAVISIDSTEAGVGLIDGDVCIPLKAITSGVGGKSSKGGSSFRRYERNRNANLNQFYHRVANLVDTLLLPYLGRLTGLVISGPMPTPEKFLEKEYMDYRLRQKISRVIGIEYSGIEGIWQTFNRLRSEGLEQKTPVRP